MAAAECAGCGRTYYRRTGTHKYCTAACRERHRDPAHRQRYSSSHQKLRAAVAVAVERGEASCARCGRPIEPGVDDWDLDHSDDGDGYLWPSHARCNRATTPRVSSTGLRWSRRWHDNPPTGTVVVGEEVFRSGGWEPL